MEINVLQWLGFSERRISRAERVERIGLVAYYWDGAAPHGRRVKNISTSGAYIYTSEPLYRGTILRASLQLEEPGMNGHGDDKNRCLSVACRVVRQDAEGIGVSFVIPDAKQRRALAEFVRRLANKMPPGWVLRRGNEGASLVEFALLLPLLLMLILNIVNFGAFIGAWVGIANAARTAADYAILNSSSAGTQSGATSTQLNNLISADLAHVPNVSSTNPAIWICQNQNGTAVAIVGTCSSPPQDPETASAGGTFTNVTVDLTYTFTPLAGSFSFSSLGVRLVSLPTTIHRRTVMRVN